MEVYEVGGAVRDALLGRPVDLVTEDALRERLRPHVERDAIPV